LFWVNFHIRYEVGALIYSFALESLIVLTLSVEEMALFFLNGFSIIVKNQLSINIWNYKIVKHKKTINTQLYFWTLLIYCDFLFLTILRFELRASHLQGRCSTTWVTPPALSIMFVFLTALSWLLYNFVVTFEIGKCSFVTHLAFPPID
jgi:hypothetical protein